MRFPGISFAMSISVLMKVVFVFWVAVLSIHRSQAMKSRDVLVLGNHANRELVEVLSRFGFVPQVWGSVQHSLEKLRHQKFAAILVDRNFTHADVLEFVLNVRDIDKKVPVVVIGPGPEKIDRKIAKQDRTVILGTVESGNELADRLKEVMKENENRDVPTQVQT